MKKSVLLALFSLPIFLFPQSNTEVFLLDITKKDDAIALTNLRNISNNEGYDNQPSFYNNHTLLFASTRYQQTDIKSYDLVKNAYSWKTNTTTGSEYSPLKIPNATTVSSVRLDDNGLQRLYQYDLATGKPSMLLKEAKVGYHVWYSEHLLVASVLVADRMDLVVYNLKTNTNDTIQKNVGRSLHKIPNSDLIGFLCNENETTTIKSLHPISGAITTIKTLPIPIKDICWMTKDKILIPDGEILAQLDTAKDAIRVLHHFTEDVINDISRITVSPDRKHLALVSEESPKAIVQKQLEAFNTGNVSHFASFFSDDVVVKNFPDDTLYTGLSKLKSKHQELFAKQPKAKMIKRINKKGIVIDETLVQLGGKEQHGAVIYEIKNGKISSMIFIHEKQQSPQTETIVQAQFDAWNAKNIDAFVKTFSNEIQVYTFSNKLYANGQKELHALFSEQFTQAPDLHCTLTHRIVIGNVVIDEEFLTSKTEQLNAIAIYQVENGKISKMITVN